MTARIALCRIACESRDFRTTAATFVTSRIDPLSAVGLQLGCNRRGRRGIYDPRVAATATRRDVERVKQRDGDFGGSSQDLLVARVVAVAAAKRALARGEYAGVYAAFRLTADDPPPPTAGY
jgi:hypothetical protein